MVIPVLSLGFILLAVVLIILGIVKIHTYPGKIAKQRHHPQADAIDVTSLLGLIIFPFWMAALIWAYSGAVIGKLYAPQAEDSGALPPADSEPDEPVAKQNATN